MILFLFLRLFDEPLFFCGIFCFEVESRGSRMELEVEGNPSCRVVGNILVARMAGVARGGELPRHNFVVTR